jgi:hypothetical protein
MTEQMELVDQLVKTVQRLKHDQEVQIRHLADLQLKLDEADLKFFSEKIGAVFSNASETQQLLKKVLDELSMEFNKLKANQ